MSSSRVAACGLLGLVAAVGACAAFAAEPAPTPAPDDAGAAALDAVAPPVDSAPGDASTFCGDHATALFCDDFEANDLSTRWPLQELALGLADVVDGSSVGRPGKVLRFVRTKPGNASETTLRLRRQLGAAIAVRVAYDLRTNDWPVEAGLSSFTAGNVVHGGLNSWLAFNGTAKSLGFLAYTGDATFARRLGDSAGLRAPVNRWEHYEVVVIPGDPAHFELWVGSPPVQIAQDNASVTFPNGGTFSPTFVEIGFSRSNAGPMPAIEAYYDNVVVTAAR